MLVLLILMPFTPALGAAPLPFVPFTVQDIVNPATGQPCHPGETLTFPSDDGSAFSGSVDDLVASLNERERQYNQQGISLRQPGNIVHDYPGDPELLAAQLLTDLHLSVTAMKNKVKPAVTACESLALPELGLNPRTGKVYATDDPIPVEPGVVLTATQFVGRVNNIQQVLCTLGYSFLGELGGAAAIAGLGDGAAALVAKRDDLLAALGISRFDSKVDWQPLAAIKSYKDLKENVQSLAEARQTPSPAQLASLRQKADAVLPADLQIPDLPNIPAPIPPRRTDLDLKKRKDWSGFNEGDPSRFSAYASAYYEIRGSESQEDASAEVKAGVFVLGNEINALYGYGDLYAGPDEVHGKLMLRAFGQDLFAPLEFKDAVKYQVSDRKHFHYAQELSYNQQLFIGPIPVTITAGANTEVYVGWELALLTTELNGTLTPGGDASAFVRGGVGAGGFLSVGAEGSVLLLDLSPVLSGSAGVRFDPSGVPFLRMGLNADMQLAALDGQADAFAEYPVPRFGLPPWTTKRSTLELCHWAGIHERQKIFNWGLELTPYGASLSGDLLDQTDRDETRHLQDLLTLDQRRQALATLEGQVDAKEHDAFAAIDGDLGSEGNRKISGAVESLQEAGTLAKGERDGYRGVLVAFLGGHGGAADVKD
jgi:hypothetical protein